eukprot:scaffold6929_cov99-Cylindrotheca_fusiformis.AAC.4
MAISCQTIARGSMKLTHEQQLLKPERDEEEDARTADDSSSSDGEPIAALQITPGRRISYNPSDSSQVDLLLTKLRPDEVEDAAMASYEYMKNPVVSERAYYASLIVRRFLSSKRYVDTALPKLKATLEFRREIDIPGLMQAFENNSDSSEYANQLKKHLSSKKMYVQGFDKEGRATLIFIPRLAHDHDIEWTLKEAVYSIERAIACSKSEDGLINAVVDFSGFSVTKNAPPLEIGKQFLTTLRNHYAGQIHSIFLLDTPSTFSFFWKVFKPFIGKKTTRKIHFLSGKSKSKMNEFYEVDQAPSWMLPGGKKSRDLDVDEYLFETPFNRAFDEDED